MSKSLDVLYKAGVISKVEYDAGMKFESDFIRAGFEALHGVNLESVGGGSDRISQQERTVMNGEQISRAMSSLGGMTAPCGNVAWHVLGLDESINQWAAKFHWDNKEARGFLIAAVNILARHYGYM